RRRRRDRDHGPGSHRRRGGAARARGLRAGHGRRPRGVGGDRAPAAGGAGPRRGRGREGSRVTSTVGVASRLIRLTLPGDRARLVPGLLLVLGATAVGLLQPWPLKLIV